MFDRVTVNQSPAYPQYVNVTEKRAPTDDSVRLLKEFRQAAEKDLVSSLKLENNLISATLHVYKDPLQWKEQYVVLTKINGKNFRIEVERDPYQKETWEEVVFNRVAEYIAAELLGKAGKLKEY
jgi:hypothetical protein